MGLDSVELVLSVEEHFKIEIPDRIAQKLNSVGLLHAFVVSELGRLKRTDISSEQAFEKLRELICYHLDVEPWEVVSAARFVQDLRMN